jgi:hypothetical protein
VSASKLWHFKRKLWSTSRPCSRLSHLAPLHAVQAGGFPIDFWGAGVARTGVKDENARNGGTKETRVGRD